jgi:hypothetical protein
MKYIELLKEDGIIPEARTTGEMLLKFDKNNGCSCCVIRICCDEEYQFDIVDRIICWIVDHGIEFIEGLAWHVNK